MYQLLKIINNDNYVSWFINRYTAVHHIPGIAYQSLSILNS